jgi:hypothetical protein
LGNKKPFNPNPAERTPSKINRESFIEEETLAEIVFIP